MLITDWQNWQKRMGLEPGALVRLSTDSKRYEGYAVVKESNLRCITVAYPVFSYSSKECVRVDYPDGTHGDCSKLPKKFNFIWGR